MVLSEFVHDTNRLVWTAVSFLTFRLKKKKSLLRSLEEAGLELIRLVTLTTPIERIRTISNKGRGFLYTVTVKGITGTRKEFDVEVGQFLKSVKAVSSLPVVAGFGISNERQIIELTSYCDGVVVGSKIIDLFNKNDLSGLESLMSVLSPERKV